jgi:hypothetical protein
VLLLRLKDLAASLSPKTNDNPQATFNEAAEKLKTNPSPDGPPSDSPQKQTYDEMVLNLLLTVGQEAKKAAVDGGDAGAKLQGLLDEHVVKLGKHTEGLEKELETEEKEQKKHITSEDIHDGFDNKVSTNYYSHKFYSNRINTVRPTKTSSSPSTRCQTRQAEKTDNQVNDPRSPQLQNLLLRPRPRRL